MSFVYNEMTKETGAQVAMNHLRILLLLASTGLTGGAAAAELEEAATWNRERAAHLLRRAGFGGTEAQIETLTALGLREAVEYIVDYEKIPPADPPFRVGRMPAPRSMRELTSRLGEEKVRELRRHQRALNRAQLEDLRAWWVRRMVVTERPFEEKMTLFWHGHFTSGAREVRSSAFLARQNELFRQHAVGSFGELLLAVCKDPAMLRYLDNASNRKQKPNENFARELLELFTMGEGNYTEGDIKSAARAFTGWGVGQDGFVFRRGQHDFAPKAFLGATGPLDGDDIVRTILNHPATARFLAKKLVRFFVSDDPSPRLVRAAELKLRSTRYDIRETMRMIFRSEAFYADDVMFNHIKSPPEFVIGAIKSLEIDPEDCDFHALASRMGTLGQVLFQPPNVKGWDGGQAWITSATLVRRQELVSFVINGQPRRATMRRENRTAELESIREEFLEMIGDSPGVKVVLHQVPTNRQMPADLSGLLPGRRAWPIGEAIDELFGRLLPQAPGPEIRGGLIGQFGGEKAVLDPSRPRGVNRLKQIIQIITSLPEFHVS